MLPDWDINNENEKSVHNELNYSFGQHATKNIHDQKANRAAVADDESKSQFSFNSENYGVSSTTAEMRALTSGISANIKQTGAYLNKITQHIENESDIDIKVWEEYFMYC